MQKTCFVIMGFQTKKIPNTNISIDLDVTYKYLIKPVLIKSNLVSVYSDERHKHAFRCDEVYTTEAINNTFIKNLYVADIVIADITTLNQNAIYELGMRHAMKPKSTIIMCDKKTIDNNKFFDLTFNPQIIYDSDKQKDIDEIKRVSYILSNVIQTCKNSDDTYIDSPVFHLKLYDKPIDKPIDDQFSENSSLSEEISQGRLLLENEKYAEAEKLFYRILNEYSYISEDIVCSYILASYKKNLSVENLEDSFDKIQQYISLEHTTCEDILGIAAAIQLRLFNLTKEPKFLYKSIEYYRKGANYESGNIYCARNYCATLLKIYQITDDKEILREYYYSAKHNAKVFLTKTADMKRKADPYNNIWFLSNQNDLLLIANNITNTPFHIIPTTKRQETTIMLGRQELEKDFNAIKSKI